MKEWLRSWMARGGYQRTEHLLFGSQLEACRRAFLEEMKDSRRLLIIGAGDGRLLRHLLDARSTAVEALYLIEPDRAASDQSAGLLEKFREMGITCRLFSQQLTQAPVPRRDCDAVACQFFLDLFKQTELGHQIASLENLLAPKGRLFVADFLPWRQPAMPHLADRLRIRASYTCFRWLYGASARSVPDWPRALERAGFAPDLLATIQAGFLEAGIWRKRR
jgi:SAM-dependent methyltransferase